MVVFYDLAYNCTLLHTWRGGLRVSDDEIHKEVHVEINKIVKKITERIKKLEASHKRERYSNNTYIANLMEANNKAWKTIKGLEERIDSFKEADIKLYERIEKLEANELNHYKAHTAIEHDLEGHAEKIKELENARVVSAWYFQHIMDWKFKWFSYLKGKVEDLEKKLDMVDTIATATAIGTDLHPKKIEKLEDKWKEIDKFWTGIQNNNIKSIKELEQKLDDHIMVETSMYGKVDTLSAVMKELLEEFEISHDQAIIRDFFTGLLKKLEGTATEGEPSCEHLLNYDETYCTKCHKSIIQIEREEQESSGKCKHFGVCDDYKEAPTPCPHATNDKLCNDCQDYWMEKGRKEEQEVDLLAKNIRIGFGIEKEAKPFDIRLRTAELRGYVRGVQEQKKVMIAEFLEDLKRLPDSKESFRLIEKWESRRTN